MEIDIEALDGMIVEGYRIRPPHDRVILKANRLPGEESYVSLEPIKGALWQVRAPVETLLKGGPVTKNLRILGIIPPVETN